MPRVPWQDLPARVRDWAEGSLGSAVIAAASQPGGFSPGAACRLRLAGGRRAFVKAVSASANPDSPVMHRREGAIAAALPPRVPAPVLLGQYDDGEWVALLFADVDGQPPTEPWQLPQLIQVLDAIAEMHRICTPSPVATVPGVAEYLAEDLSGWRKLAASGQVGLERDGHAGPGPRSDLLARLDSDLRADNMLITDDGVVFVDWPHACTGAPWFDVLAFAPSVAMQGGPDPEWILGRARSAHGADPDAVTAVVAGYFTRQSLLPSPPGLPTVRAFQAAQGEHARAWLRRRTGWR